MASMKKLLSLLLVATLLATTASFALDRSQLPVSGPAVAASGHAPQADDTDMQALCHEVLVDIDQGYGVTSRESRHICSDKDR